LRFQLDEETGIRGYVERLYHARKLLKRATESFGGEVADRCTRRVDAHRKV
jgi:hypothetical protein